MTAPNSTHFQQVTYRAEGDVAVITMNNPPVNGLSLGIRRGLIEAFTEAKRNAAIRAVVLTGHGRGFSAGADIKEFGTPAALATPALSLNVHPVIESCPKPVIAAIHGLAIGGGLETAMVCHYRIVCGNTRIGLPELKLGVIPVSGSQRLPRILGLERAIDLILSSRLLLANNVRDCALFDQIIDGDADRVTQTAIAFAHGQRVADDAKHRTLPLIRDIALPDPDPSAAIEQARRRIDPDDFMAQEGLNAIAAGVSAASFDDGLAAARAIHTRLAQSDHVREQRDRFFASQEKSPE